MVFSDEVVRQLRARFPALQRDVVHFDNPAGTQVPQHVIDAVVDYYATMNANSGGAFTTSQRSDAMVRAAREMAADFLNATRPEEIAFGPNMTTLMFGLSRAIGKTLQPGDEIVLTLMDHDANIAPWMLLAEDYDLKLRWVDINVEDCTLDMGGLEGALTDRTKVVATIHASNAVGTVNPVQQIAAMAHAAGAWYVVDAVQSAPHVLIDVQAIDCDFLLCSAYKFYGPHVGVMWGKHDLMENLPAYKVRPAKDAAPYRWETGTPSYETIAGTMAALGYLAEIGERYAGASGGRRQHFESSLAAIAQYERELVGHLIEVLQTLPGIEIAGIIDPARFQERVPTVAFRLARHHPDAIAEYLAQHDIYVWSGHYYALAIMERLGKLASGGMVRVGLAHYNTHAEINRLGEALHAMRR